MHNEKTEGKAYNVWRDKVFTGPKYIAGALLTTGAISALISFLYASGYTEGYFFVKLSCVVILLGISIWKIAKRMEAKI